MILVTGATGAVGAQVVRVLRGLDQPVRALVRKGSEYFWLNDTGCHYFFGDLRDPRSLARACRDVRFVVVCSGVRWQTRDNHHDNVTHRGHAALFAAARERGVERVVLLSWLGVDRGFDAPGFRARAAAEEALADSGLDHAIVRAGPTEHLFTRMAWLTLDLGRVVMPGPGTNRLAPLCARDLARVLAACVDLPGASGRRFEVGGPAETNPRDAYAAACRQVGVAPRSLHLPGPLVAVGTRVGRPFRRFSERLAELAPWFTEDLTGDPAEAGRTFGVQPAPLAEGIAATCAEERALRDPEERQRRIVHPPFHAAVYEPGTAFLDGLPAGPPPRRG